MQNKNSTSHKQRESGRTNESTPKRSQVAPEALIELSPTIDIEEPWKPATERLNRLLWPSPSSRLVTEDILSLLHRARDVFRAKGFPVPSDPLNTCGDGKSWELVVDPPATLPKGVDALELAAICQAQIVADAPRPMWEGENIIVPLWPGAPSVSTTESNKPQTSRASVKKLDRTVSILASRVAGKLQNPTGNPVMTVDEAAHALQKSKATIYRWVEEGKLRWSKVHGRILTDSVKRLLEPSEG